MARTIGSQTVRVQELAEILALYKEYRKQGIGVQMCYERVAEETGRTSAAISKCIRRMLPTTDMAEEYIKAQAMRMAVRLVREAKVPEVIDVLSRRNVGVLAPRAEEGGGQGGFFLSVQADSCGAVKIGVMHGLSDQKQLPHPAQTAERAENSGLQIVDGHFDGAEAGSDDASDPEEAEAARPHAPYVSAAQGHIRAKGHLSPEQQKAIDSARARVQAVKVESMGRAREVRMSKIREKRALEALEEV